MKSKPAAELTPAEAFLLVSKLKWGGDRWGRGQSAYFDQYSARKVILDDAVRIEIHDVTRNNTMTEPLVMVWTRASHSQKE